METHPTPPGTLVLVSTTRREPIRAINATRWRRLLRGGGDDQGTSVRQRISSF